MLLRRMTASDLDDAPDLEYITNQNDAINKLVDQVSTPEKPQSIKLLKQADVETFDIDVQVPDPWFSVGVGSAPAFQNSYSGTAKYMKSYDGQVNLTINSVANGAGTIVFKLPNGFWPAADVNQVIWDGFTGAATALMTIKPDGTVNMAGIGAHTFSAYASFLAIDVTPVILPCFPVTLKTALKNVTGMLVLDVSDGGSTGATATAQSGSAGSVDFTTTSGPKGLQIMVKNIMGLPYNRKSHVRLLAISGS